MSIAIKKLTPYPSLSLNNRPAVTLDGDHHHPQMTGVHPLVVSRANPAAAVVSQGRAEVPLAREIGVHHRQTHGAHHPRVRVVRAVADQVNLVRAEVDQVDLEMAGGVHHHPMIGVHLPRVRAERVAVAAVNRASLEVPRHQEMVDGEAGDLILHHGDRVPAVRVARAAQAVVNLARAEVHHHQEIGVTHVHQVLATGDHHPRVNLGRVDQGVN